MVPKIAIVSWARYIEANEEEEIERQFFGADEFIAGSPALHVRFVGPTDRGRHHGCG